MQWFSRRGLVIGLEMRRKGPITQMIKDGLERGFEDAAVGLTVSPPATRKRADFQLWVRQTRVERCRARSHLWVHIR